MAFWMNRGSRRRAARLRRGRRGTVRSRDRQLQLEPLETRSLLSSSPSAPVDLSDLLDGYPGFEGLTVDEVEVYSRQIGEAGTVAVDASDTALWHTVQLDQDYADPVVLASPVSADVGRPAMVRVRNVADDSFQFQIDAWDYDATAHGPTTIGYLVLEAGRHTLDDGTCIEAGTLGLVRHAWARHQFAEPFDSPPVVLTQAVTANDPAAVVTRQRYVTASGFQVRLQEEENSDDSHGREVVSYVAIDVNARETGERLLEAGTVPGGVSDPWQRLAFAQTFETPPVLFAAAQTYDEADPIAPRYRNVDAGGADVALEEEQSADAETGHAAETVGFLLLDPGPIEITLARPAELTIGEVGSVAFFQDGPDAWHEVLLSREYVNPVVIMSPASTVGSEAVNVRVRHVTADRFEYQLDEWDYSDGRHATEEIGYLVIEAGRHVLPDGTRLEAGTISSVRHGWGRYTFFEEFAAAPVVLTQVMTQHDAAAVVVRHQAVTTWGFKLRVQEEQAADRRHAGEVVGYLAMEPGRGTTGLTAFEAASTAETIDWHWNPVTFQGNYDDPVLLASVQTTNGGDPIVVRHDQLSGTGMQLRLQEETSFDKEVVHLKEVVDYAVFEPGLIVARNVRPFVGTIGATGLVTVVPADTETWVTVEFARDYLNPVVVMQPSSTPGAAAVTTRVRNVAAGGFEFQLSSWSGTGVAAGTQTVQYLVMEAGHHELESGVVVEAGTLGAVTPAWTRRRFSSMLDNTPVVVSQTVSDRDSATVGTELRKVSAAGFDVRLQEPGGADGVHAAEAGSYVAIASGSASGSLAELVGSAAFDAAPLRAHIPPAAASDFSGQAVDLALLELLGAVHLIHDPVEEPPPPFEAYFDFGTGNSPLSFGYQRVTHALRYDSSRGFGWQAGNIASSDRGTSTALVRDLNYTGNGTFAVDLPKGTYQVDLIAGDAGNVRHDGVGVFLEGEFRGKVNTAPGQVVGRGFTVEVTDGQLNLQLRDLAGSDPHAAIQALRVYTAGVIQPGVSGPWWPLPPNIPGGFFYPPVRSGAFDVVSVDSAYQRSVTKIRVLTPDTMEPGKEYRVVYVLPVEPGERHDYGDGLATVRRLNLHNRYGVIFVAPTFTDMPWYADHISNKRIWQETHFRSVVVPLVEEIYPVVPGPDGRLLLGFSKSGYGAFSMLLRHPDVFGRAVAWDAPVAMSDPSTGWAFTDILGSSQNFQNYRITTLLRQRKTLLRDQPPRLLLLGYGSMRQDHLTVHQLMNELGIPHVFQDGPHQNHHWDGGWVPNAVARLLG